MRKTAMMVVAELGALIQRDPGVYTLLVSSPDVRSPQEVRYAWATNPIGATLKGKANGIPVFPFRWKAWPRGEFNHLQGE